MLQTTAASAVCIVSIFGMLVFGVPEQARAYYYDNGFDTHFCYDIYCDTFYFGDGPTYQDRIGYDTYFVPDYTWDTYVYEVPYVLESYEWRPGRYFVEESWVWDTYEDPLVSAYGYSTILDEYPYPVHSFVTIERDPWADVYVGSPHNFYSDFYSDWDLAWASGAW